MKTTFFRTIGQAVMIFLAVGISGYAFSYFNFNVQNLLLSKDRELLANVLYRSAFYMHAGFGAIALFTGSWQFLKKFRNRNLTRHRLLGKIYVCSVLLSSVAGLGIAAQATGGLIPRIGFSILALLWFWTNVQAYRTIRQGNVAAHQQWMTRNYALTFAAVTLRLWLPLLQFGFALPFMTAYPIVAWLCWIPNLLVAEWLVRSQQKEIPAISQKA
jgi:uncharacterized membrane protein